MFPLHSAWFPLTPGAWSPAERVEVKNTKFGAGILVQPLTSHPTLGKLFTFPEFQLFTCSMKIIIAPISQICGEDQESIMKEKI